VYPEKPFSDNWDTARDRHTVSNTA
jgi:hypothetical protein